MNKPLTVALPKGRVLEQAQRALVGAGLNLRLDVDDRKLRHEAPEGTVLVMRNHDVPKYVELGVAEIGVVGKDVLEEAAVNVYEPVDLRFAACRMSLIRPAGETGPIRRVASKYPHVAARYLAAQGVDADVVHLAGNVELACISGLSDAVVDVVETGSTLKANDLEEVDVVFESSARFIVNRAALKLRHARLKDLIDRLRSGVQ